MVDSVRLEGFLRNPTYDYVPLLSTAVGLINLFYKCVILPYKDKSAIANNRYYTYLQQKSFLRCTVILFPIVGNIAIGCYDLFHSKATTQTNVTPSTQRSSRSLTLTTDHSSSKREAQVPPSSPNASRQNHPRTTTDQPIFAPLIFSSSRKEPRAALSHPASGVDRPAENATPASLAPTRIISSSLPTSSLDISIAIGFYALFHSKATTQTNVIPSTQRSPRSLTLTTDPSSSKREAQAPPSPPNPSRQNHPRATRDQPVFAPLIPFSSRKESRAALSHPGSGVDHSAENANPHSLAPTKIIPSTLPTNSADISSDPRYHSTTKHDVLQNNSAPLPIMILAEDSGKKAETRYDKLPRLVLAQCIEFVGNALVTSSVSKHFLYSSYNACQSIAKGIIAKVPNSNTESEDSNVYGYWNPIKTIHSTCIDQVRGLRIKVDRPQEVPLQTLIQQISARNFNLFFTAMLKQFGKRTLPLTREEKNQVIAQQKLWSAERDDLEKAKQGRIWMQKNQAILQKIDSLDLIRLGLSHLPPEIGLLTELKDLNLSRNRLKFLPREIGSLTKLKRLYLHRNQLESLPREIGSLTKLEQLYLHHNQLESLPREIGSLTKLKVLHLHNNQLKSLSREIGSLTELQLLYLHHNQLKSLPQEIGCLTKLEELSLNSNQLKSLPQEIRFLTRLRYLLLSYNQLESLPREIGSLTRLKVLHLHNNQLKSLPREIGSLTKLGRLFLSNNQLKSLPREIGCLTKLEKLYLNNNQLESLPREIACLTALQRLALWSNPLKSLPQEVYQPGVAFMN